MVTFRGADAAQFLHGQLTTNTETLAAGSWQRTAYCSRQGRMLANGILAHLPQEGEGAPCFAFVLGADIAESVAAMLKKFVLRAKVVVEVAAARVFVEGADATPPALAGGAVTLRDSGDGGMAAIDEGGGRVLLFNVDAHGAEDAQEGQGDGSAAWQRAEIDRGIAWVSAATQDAIIPQFVNLELLGGVDFHKGCFVGQEVIARLHHLGEVKRRGMIVHGGGGASAAAAGDALKTAEDKPCGEIVNSVPTEGGFIALAAVARSAVAAEGAAEINCNGSAVTVQPPPYPIVEQEKFKRR